MKLKEGEIKCPECDGTGIDKKQLFCFKCYGDGKLDWIETVVGKKDPYVVLPKILNGEYPKLIAKDILSVQPMTDEVSEAMKELTKIKE